MSELGKRLKETKSLMGHYSYSKVVYVLGAGFSCDGKIPIQSQILERILSYKLDILSGKNAMEFMRLSETILPAKQKVEKFLKDIFASNQTPSLEDVFTLLDQTVARRGYCFGYAWPDLDTVRDSLKKIILILFHDALEKLKKEKVDFYKQIAAYFIEKRIKAGLDADEFSFISLNWDSLIEDAVFECLKEIKGYKKFDIDFCCFTSKLGANCPHSPSITQKAKGIYNLKLLKLHGSSNWMLCPNCNRLYTGIGGDEDIWNLYVLKRDCEHCFGRQNIAWGERSPGLEPFFITPTFAKVFDNTHIQMVWDNAYVELSEAQKVVFIGYSLPEADYHFRTLLRRAINPKTPVEVVLTAADKPARNTEEKIKRYYPKIRYENFFGKKRIKFFFEGTRKYFKNITHEEKLSVTLNRIKKIL